MAARTMGAVDLAYEITCAGFGALLEAHVPQAGRIVPLKLRLVKEEPCRELLLSKTLINKLKEQITTFYGITPVRNVFSCVVLH